jgi:hypothetical protein
MYGPDWYIRLPLPDLEMIDIELKRIACSTTERITLQPIASNQTSPVRLKVLFINSPP